MGTEGTWQPWARLPLPPQDASAGDEPLAGGLAAPRSPGEGEEQQRSAEVADAQHCLADRNSRLGKQRYIYLKHSLFFYTVLNAVSPPGDAASIHPDTSGSKGAREAGGILVKRR